MSVLLSKSDAALTVTPETTIHDVVQAMEDRGVAAAIVVERDRPIGIFTTRDLMSRVVLRDLDAERARVGEVMTSKLVVVRADTDPVEARQRMIEHAVRHLPVVDGDGRVLGMLTMRRLLEDEADVLRSEATSLENYAGYDGATG